MSFLEQPGFSDDVRAVLTDLLGLPPAFMDYTVQYNALNGLPIPVSQLSGFTQFAARGAVIETSESTTSTSFVDLTTVGPELSELPDGHYVVSWGASCFTSDATKQALIALDLNGSTDAAVYTEQQGSSPLSVARGGLLTMSNNNNNTLKCVYASGANTSTASFRHRWLNAIKYGNL